MANDVDFRGESPAGDWEVIVKDTQVNEFQGDFVDWRINFWGEAIDGAKQHLHPLPDEHDDDHPYEDPHHIATVSINPGPTKTGAPGSVDDHHDRPINQKPTDTPSEPTSTQPTAPVDDHSDEELNVVHPSKPGTPTGAASPTSTSASPSDSYLSSYLPTFGASKRTQIWIYASFAMIIVFFIGLGVYFQLQRIKRRRTNVNDDYEFEMIEDEEELQPMTGGAGRTQRRGGELYNAFAGESDEEIFSDDGGDELYHDRLANISEKDEDNPSPSSGLLSEKP